MLNHRGLLILFIYQILCFTLNAQANTGPNSLPNSIDSSHPLRQSDLLSVFSRKSLVWQGLNKLSWNSSGSPLTSECYQNIQEILNQLQNSDVISLKMIDSSGGLPNGFLDGTLTDFGDFDECLSIRYTSNASGVLNKLTGKHCMVKMKPILDPRQYRALESSWMVKNSFPLNIGVCLPSSCSDSDVKLIVSQALYPSYIVEKTPFCEEPTTLLRFLHLTVGQLISILYILMMIIVVSMASLYDIYLRWKKRKVNKVVSSLSAVSAMLDLLSANNERFKSRKKSIDVMRFVWVVIIIAAHASFCGIEPKLIYKVARLDAAFPGLFGPFGNQPFFNAAVIEGFFYIGGFVTYVSMHSTLFKEQGSMASFAVNRWLRYMPGMLSIMAVEQVWPLLTTGPMMAEVRDNIYTNCGKNWWKNILFINNFDGLNNMCLIHTWYISADIQLFLLALMIMAVLRSHRRIGITLMYAMIILGMIFTGLTAFLENHIPAIILANKDWWGFLDFIDYSYLPTTPHITPYFMGVLFGYYFKNDIQILNKSIEKFLWFLCPTVFITITFMPSLWNTFGLEPQDYYSSAVYLTFYRFLWTASFAWGISCLTKYIMKGIAYLKKAAGMNPTLSNRFEPKSQFEVTSLILGVARLYFSVYLVHAIFIRWNWSTSRSLYTLSAFDGFERMVLSTGMSGIYALIFFLLFEGPFENLRNHIFKKSIE